MNKKLSVVALAILLGCVFFVYAKPAAEQIQNRIAQLQDTYSEYTWTAASSPIEIDWANTVLPDGMQITEDGTNINFALRATTPGIYEATITLQMERMPDGVTDWNGSLIRASNTSLVKWVVYKVDQSDFLIGFGDVLMFPVSDPNL